MNSSNVALIAALSTAAGTILGVIITSFINARTNRLNREADERKHYKEIVVKAAIENWKQSVEIAKGMRGGATIYPLESFLISTAAAADVIFDRTTNAENLAERLQKADELVRISEQCALERTEQRRASKT